MNTPKRDRERPSILVVEDDPEIVRMALGAERCRMTAEITGDGAGMDVLIRQKFGLGTIAALFYQFANGHDASMF